jgi:PAS domain S-box-containing protein
MSLRRRRNMERKTDPGAPVGPLLAYAPLVAAAVAIVIGGMVLVGWAYGIVGFISVRPGLATMKPNTAACFVLAGLALALVGPDRPGRAALAAGRACAAALALVGLVTLAEDFGGFDLGIDWLLLRDVAGVVQTRHPGRMPVQVAVNFLLLGGALLCLAAPGDRGPLWAQGLALATALSALPVLVGYAYGVRALSGAGPPTPVALHTAAAFFLLGAGVLCARPRHGPMALVSGPTLGGVVVRRQLPAFLAALFVMGWLRVAGQQAGLFDAAFGTALLVVMGVVVFGALVVWTARVLHAIDLDRRRAGEALRESERRLQQLADSMPQIVWMARPDGYIDYYNERWYEYTGFERGVYGEASWKPILHPDDVGRCLDTYFGCIRSGRVYEIEYRFWDRRTGGFRWFLGRAQPVRDSAGRVVRWFGTCTDIDGQKRREEAVRFLADAGAALASLLDVESTLRQVARLAVPFFADWCAVHVVGEGGRIECVASAHADPEKEGLLGQLWERYPTTWDSRSPLVGVLRTGQPYLRSAVGGDLSGAFASDPEHRRLLRGLAPGSALLVPLTVRGRTFGVLGFFRSAPARGYEEQDRALAEDLAGRAAVAVDNARLYQETKEADRRKDEFLAMLAHELRNPLAPIRNAVELLRLAEPLGPPLHRAREVIGRQVQHMSRLVDDLLDLSRIRRGKILLRREPVDLGEVVAGAVEASRPLLEARRHGLEVSAPAGPLRVVGDPTRLVQVVLNLLNNAGKYTPEGGHVGLCVGREGGEAVVRVRDDGVGIAADLLPRVFDLFTQADRTLDRAEGGLGIGLALVKKLVEMHGGTAEAHSEGPNRGSEFVVRLPLLKDEG